MLCFGVAEAFFPIRPFWNDEWRLIYNLKFKNVSQLWGTLDLLQECPRVYLTVLKKVTSYFDYGYTALRLPALVLTATSIVLAFYLKKKVFPGKSTYTYLFILILISSQTFTDYIVQVKHYEMEIFLCLLAIWQLITLLEIGERMIINNNKYLLLCFSFLVAPFFGYTYPIAIAPVFPVVIYSSVVTLRIKQSNKTSFLLYQYLPLFIVAASILTFYFIDVKQLMADKRMYASYLRMLGNQRGENHFLGNFWQLFSLVGSGCVYEIVFGILGVGSFVYGIYLLVKTEKSNYNKEYYIRLYAVLLLIITIGLIFSGRLMGGVARLTAFTVPSISILIIAFITGLRDKYNQVKQANLIAALLFVGLFGNIITSYINPFIHQDYNEKIEAYRTTYDALKLARLSKIPILITDGIRGDELHPINKLPGKIRFHTITTDQIIGRDTLCTEVILKVNPGYSVTDTIPVYLIPDIKSAGEYMKQLPSDVTTAVACDGLSFIKLPR